MKYDVTYRCGHTGRVDLVGKGSDRESRIAWLATCDCPDCQAAYQKAHLESREAELKMPELTGSDKQIAWARDLRLARMDHLDAYIIEEAERSYGIYNKRMYSPEMTAQIAAVKEMLFGWLRTKTDSKFYIDNRDIKTIAELLGKYADEWNK